jgi:hypothetical protein
MKIIAFTILLISSLTAWQSSVADTMRYSAGIGLETEDFHYEEENDRGDTIDTEDGLLPGVTLTSKAVSGSWFITGEYQLLNGEVDYRATPSNDNVLKSNTDTRIDEISLSLGYSLDSMKNVEYEFSGGVGLRLWDRNIQSLPDIAGLKERYNWPYMQFGLSGIFQFSSKDTGIVVLRVKKAFNPTLDVKFKNGLYDSVTIDLDEGKGLELQTMWNHYFEDKTHLEFGPYLRYWWFDKSDSTSLTKDDASVGLVYEPASITRSLGLRLSLLMTF